MKDYIVTYYIKANRAETEHTMTVQAANAAAACKMCKQKVRDTQGRNAFRPKAVAAPYQNIGSETLTETTPDSDLDYLQHTVLYSEDFSEMPKEELRRIYIYCVMHALNKCCRTNLAQIRYAATRAYLEVDF